MLAFENIASESESVEALWTVVGVVAGCALYEANALTKHVSTFSFYFLFLLLLLQHALLLESDRCCDSESSTKVRVARDRMHPDELSVYVPCDKAGLPLGLIPGATIVFSRLRRRCSDQQNVYCTFTAVSALSVRAVPGAGTDTVISAQALATRYCDREALADILSAPPARASICVHVELTALLSFTASLRCGRCGAALATGGLCPAGCGAAAGAMLCEVLCACEDGTAEALLTARDDRALRLLRLSEIETAELRAAV